MNTNPAVTCSLTCFLKIFHGLSILTTRNSPQCRKKSSTHQNLTLVLTVLYKKKNQSVLLAGLVRNRAMQLHNYKESRKHLIWSTNLPPAYTGIVHQYNSNTESTISFDKSIGVFSQLGTGANSISCEPSVSDLHKSPFHIMNCRKICSSQ
jgi:hypothetical protein